VIIIFPPPSRCVLVTLRSVDERGSIEVTIVMFDKLSDLTVHMKSLSALRVSKMISHSMAKAHHCAVLLVLLCVSCSVNSTQGDAIARAFEQHQSNVKVEGEGTVTRVLPDDNIGSPHQRFIVRSPQDRRF
jgi:hypothetical protein